jgi:hypothetical protein
MRPTLLPGFASKKNPKIVKLMLGVRVDDALIL